MLIAKPHPESGFTLIEVLIAFLILSIGLLGQAKLQGLSIMNSHDAYNRTQATQLAYDIADRMRANRAAASTYISSNLPAENASKQLGCTTINSICTASQMAENDLYEWYEQFIHTYNCKRTDSPIKCSAAIYLSGSIYRSTIRWDENRDGVLDDKDTSFETSFQL